MAYCTADQVRKKWNSRTKTEIPDDFATDCIADADALIDSKLNGIYTVPFSPVPSIIAAISKNISVFMMVADKDPNLSPDGPGRLEMNYRLALTWLDELKSGARTIPGVEPLKASIHSTTQGHAPIFNLDDELYHDIDPDLLEEIEEDRG